MPGRLLTATAAALAFVALAPPARAATNPQLAGLQVALRAYGLYLGPIDAQSGPLTAQAIRSFQRRKHLPADGIPGRRTRLALGPLGRPLFGRRTISRGAFGWDVSVLQFLLQRRGLYSGAFDGYYGPETAKAVRRYQRQLRLAADGVAGRATTAAIVLQQRVPVAAVPAVEQVALRTYAVREGDNLTLLAQRFGLSLGGLARANRLDPAKPLLIGTKLHVPARAARAAVQAPAQARTVAAVATSASAIREALGYWAAQYGVDPRLARALSWMESGFQEDVVSSVGAWGPMQLLPTTFDYVQEQVVGKPIPKTALGNVQAGVALIKHLLDSFGGDERLALGAWYQGERAVRERGFFDETKPFVANVLALKQRM
jgi:peptidoglycan hydrolase-like protein with peptidoglycan-binding domain